MAWTTPRTWAASETVTATIMNQHVRDNLAAAGVRVFTWTYVTNFSTSDIIIGQALEDGTVVGVNAYRAGGTSCSINAKINTTNICSSAIVTSDGSWGAGTLSGTSVSAGDSIVSDITAVVGTPTCVTIQVEIQLG